jgi:hypothetical protein
MGIDKVLLEEGHLYRLWKAKALKLTPEELHALLFPSRLLSFVKKETTVVYHVNIWLALKVCTFVILMLLNICSSNLRSYVDL